jgi:acetolactate synthase-1/2/3 large subunit
MRGADLLTATLANAGVKVIFSLSGNQIMPIYDACIDAGIRIIHTRHEGAAVYMAEAYSQLTGEVGIAMITAAPGFASGLGPLFMARAAENPIVLLSGDSPVSQDGRGAFQELDQVSVSAPMTKLSLRPQHAEQMGLDMAKALRVAVSGRPGPVHVALPFDLLNADVGDTQPPSAEHFAPEVTRPGDDAIQSVLDAVAAAELPVILTGPSQNTTRAQGRLEKLADALDAPVIPMESPRGLNDPCLGSLAAALARADVIVSLGKDMNFTTGFGQPPAMSATSKFLMIDPETDVLDRARRAFGSRLALAHRADADAAVRMLAELGSGATGRSDWRAEMATAIASRPAEPAEPGDGPMRPAVLCAAVQRLLDAADDPILVVDGGEFGQWAQACISAKTRVINGQSGAIGGALCYAFAAKIARPNATVVVLMGDGTVGFHFAEFETAHRYGADFIAVIGHDSRWNAEYQIQLENYGAERLNETELNPTRYDIAAAGFGCHGEHVTDPAELDAALERADKSGLPVCFVAEIKGLPAPSGSAH